MKSFVTVCVRPTVRPKLGIVEDIRQKTDTWLEVMKATRGSHNQYLQGYCLFSHLMNETLLCNSYRKILLWSPYYTHITYNIS